MGGFFLSEQIISEHISVQIIEENSLRAEKPRPSRKLTSKTKTSHPTGYRPSNQQHKIHPSLIGRTSRLLPTFIPTLVFDHTLVGGQRLNVYVRKCFCQCAVCTCTEVGLMWWNCLYLGVWGRGGKRIHQNLFTRRGTLRSKRHRRIQFFFLLLFLKE